MVKKYDIHERIYEFVIEVLKTLKIVNYSQFNSPLLNQLIRSVTSVGANDREADGSHTSKDFVKCYVIARKETRETIYWLEIFKDIGILNSDTADKLICEAEEIRKIISAIISKSIKT